MGRRSRTWAGWVGVAAFVVTLGSIRLLAGGSDGASPASRGAAAPTVTEVAPPGGLPFPLRLAYVTSGLGGGPGGQLYLESGPGQEYVFAPEGGRQALAFIWGPDGTHVAAVDVGGRAHLLPEGLTFGAQVHQLVFSHDGRSLAVCSGSPPVLSVLRVGNPVRPIGRIAPGCDPRWSPDDNYVAYHAPGAEPGIDRVVVLNAHLNLRFAVPARGPFAWASAPGYGITPLTTVTPDCTGVQVMDPRGGQRHRLADIPNLLPARHVPPAPAGTCRVSMLSWSPDGRWLAVGLRPGRDTRGYASIVDPLSGEVVAATPAASHLTPVSFAWSSRQELLVGTVTAAGAATTWQVSPIGAHRRRAILAADAVWSPDGRWILARTNGGWAAFDATDPPRSIPVAGAAQRWVQAEWCCPPTAVVRADPVRGPPRQTRPHR